VAARGLPQQALESPLGHESLGTAIQGGYLLSTASKTTEPMTHTLDAAYATLRAYRP